MLLSDVCLSVMYIRNNSRTERRRKTKIATVVAHVTRDSGTTFKVKRSKVEVKEQNAKIVGSKKKQNLQPSKMRKIMRSQINAQNRTPQYVS